METIRLNFVPPQFVVRCFPVERKTGPISLSVPDGAQLLYVDTPVHDPKAIHFWVAVPTDRRKIVQANFIVVEEGQPFDAQECSDDVELPDGSIYSDHHVHFGPVGFWTEPVADAEGSGRFTTFHILELDESEHEHPAEAEASDTSTEK